MQRQIKIIKPGQIQTEAIHEKPAKIDFFKIREKWQRETALAKELRRQTDCRMFFGTVSA